MGARKRNKAEATKEAKQKQFFASLNDCPTSPRKMRLVTELVKGEKINNALAILEHTPKEAAGRVLKLLKSAIANWEVKNGRNVQEDDMLFVKEIFVDSARSLKRIQPAPQGRAHRIKKRSNHVTLILGSRIPAEEIIESSETE